jgi:stage II sporulation protein D
MTFIIAVVLCIAICTSGPFAQPAQPCIRVLLSEGKDAKVPQKDEKLEQIGTAHGEVILGGTKYYGYIEVWKGEKGEIYVINEIPLEDYVKGVVAAEEGSQWDIEALKAQAVAARTYAVYQRLNSKTSKMGYNLTSTVLHQAYKGSDIPENIVKAVDATKGEVIMYDGSPILAYYHSTSGGMTEDPAEVFGKSYPYLKPVETDCELSPYYVWEKRISASDIEKSLNISGLKNIIIDSYTVSKRVKVFRLVTETGDIEVTGNNFRKSIGWSELPSTFITGLTRDGNIYIFEGKGYGHGVGMCQWSALEMAKEGKSYKEILSKFYPGTTVEHYEDR